MPDANVRRKPPPQMPDANAHRKCPPQMPDANVRRKCPPQTSAANVRRKCPPQMPDANVRRCRVLPRVRPPAANACGEITYTGCGLTRGKTLQRRGLRYENNRHIYGVAVLHEVRPYIGCYRGPNRSGRYRGPNRALYIALIEYIIIII